MTLRRRWPLFVILLAGPLLWSALRPAAATLARDPLRALGAQLLATGIARPGTRHLVVNGQRLVANSGERRETLAELLAARARACQPAAAGDRDGPVMQPGFVAEQSGAEAFALCLSLSPVAGLLAALPAPVADWLGRRRHGLVERLSYVFARETANGVTFLELEGAGIDPFTLATPRPRPAGDAMDAASLPAPEASTLSFFVAEEGKPYGFSVYTGGARSPRETLAGLRAQLATRGFEVNLLAVEQGGDAEGARMWARRDDLWALVVAFADRRGTTTAFAVAAAGDPNGGADGGGPSP